MHTGRLSLAATLALSAAFPAVGQINGSSTNVIFLMDDSGSMSGEQQFLTQFVQDADTALANSGVTTRNYGLVNFSGGGGTGPANIREFSLNGSQLGSAAELTALTQTSGTFTLAGATEDGYAAINHVLQNYTLPSGGGTTFVLITDEDRDNTDSTLTSETVLSALQAQGVNLVSVINVSITDTDGATAVATNGTNAFVEDSTSSSGLTSKALGNITSSAGNTIADYSTLALSTTGGCVADLNQLRSGGTAATAFAGAFQNCLVTAVVVNATAVGGTTIVFLSPYRDGAILASKEVRAQLRDLALALGDGGAQPVISSQGTGVIEDAFGIDGLRGYFLVAGSIGSTDSFGSTNVNADLSLRGFTVGADYTMPLTTGTLRFGGAYSSTNSTAKSESVMDVETAGDLFTLYGVYRQADGIQVSGDLQFGSFDQNSIRLPGSSHVLGNTEGDLFSASIEVGKRLPLSGDPGTIMPYAGVEYLSYNQDGYTESGGSVVPDFEQSITYAKVGVRYDVQGETSAGLLRMSADASLRSALSDDISIGAGGTVTSTIDTLDSTRLDLGMTASLEVVDNGRFYLQLGSTFSENSRTGRIGVGFAMAF